VEPKHILVVEDERPTRELMRKLLTLQHYRVTAVEDGIAAIKVARTDPPDLVLLDLIIPGVDGYGVCALLKRDSGFKAPIVIVSGRTAEKDVKAAFEAGADDFLAKPVDNKVLLKRVSELLAPRTDPGV
jgi:two-component system response regulator MprA